MKYCLLWHYSHSSFIHHPPDLSPPKMYVHTSLLLKPDRGGSKIYLCRTFNKPVTTVFCDNGRSNAVVTWFDLWQHMATNPPVIKWCDLLFFGIFQQGSNKEGSCSRIINSYYMFSMPFVLGVGRHLYCWNLLEPRWNAGWHCNNPVEANNALARTRDDRQFS